MKKWEISGHINYLNSHVVKSIYTFFLTVKEGIYKLF